MQIYNGTYCVYIHYFPNGKVYVGITCVSPNRRWRSDGSGYKHQIVMWNAIKKYGWCNIEHEIVASNLIMEEACNFERILIKCFHSNNHEFGYNVDNGGQTTGTHSIYTKNKCRQAKLGCRNPNYGKKMSDEQKKKISQSLKETQKQNVNTSTKAVICIETGEVFPSTVSAARFIGLSRSSLKNPLKSQRYTAGGYHWKYVKDQ